VEGGLGLVAGFNSGNDKTYLFVTMLIFVLLVVVIVAVMATFAPSALLGKQVSNEGQQTLSATRTINPIDGLVHRRNVKFAQIIVIIIVISGGGFALISGKLPLLNRTPINIAGQYKGSIDNNALNIRTSMSLLINQTQGSIKGIFTPGAKLLGAGNFIGTIDAAGNIQFKVHSDQVSEPLLFKGTVQSDGSLSGTYCSVDEQNQCDPNSGSGAWNVSII
jgi:hypothetical protein